MLKIYLKTFGYMLGAIILGIFLFTLLNYFNIISDKVMNFMKIILCTTVFIYGGWYTAKNTKKRGITEGLKIGGILTILFLIISLIFLNDKFDWKSLIYYITLIFSSIVGGIISKQKKED